MNENKENKLVPRLRFPEFETNGSWELMQIKDIIDTESSTLALNKLELKENGYAVYGADGIVGYIDNFQNSEPFISIVKDGSGVGRLNLCDANTSVLGTLSILKTKNENNFNQVWAYYLLSRINFSLYVKGSGIPHIYFSDYKSEKIGVPNPQEQQKIAACLSSLDDVITAESKKLELLKEHKKGLLQNLFPQQGETVPKLRFKEFEDSGEWEEKKLGQICKVQAGKFVSASEIKENYSDDLFPCYGGNGLRGYTKSNTHSGKYSLIGRQGALCGNVNLADGTFHATEHAVVVTPEKDVDTVWLYYMLRYLNLNQYATGQAQPGLSVTNLEKVELKIPKSIAEQQKVADTLSSIDNLINAQSQKIETLKLHKKGLLQGLFPDINEHNG